MNDKPRVLTTRAWMYPDGCHKAWGTPEQSTDAEDTVTVEFDVPIPRVEAFRFFRGGKVIVEGIVDRTDQID